MKIKLLMFVSIMILAFSAALLYPAEVNAILNDGTVINGDLLGKTTNEVIIQEAGGKVDTLKLSEIKGLFDSVTAEPLDLSVNGNNTQNLSPVPEKIIIYRPKPVIIDGPKNAIGIDLLGASFGSFGLSYERALSDWFSLRLDANYSPNYLWNSGVSFWSAAIYGRFYLTHYNPWLNTRFKGLGGMFFETGVGYEGGNIQYSYSDSMGSVNISGSFPPAPMMKFIFGNKILFGEKSGIYLEPYAGYEISFGSWNNNYIGTGSYSDPSSGPFPFVEGLGQVFLLGIEIGYSL